MDVQQTALIFCIYVLVVLRPCKNYKDLSTCKVIYKTYLRLLRKTFHYFHRLCLLEHRAR